MITVATPRAPSLADIQATVCRHFLVKPDDLVGHSRARSVAMPRQVAFYLATRLTHRSKASIGRFFGERERTTVIHGVERIRDLAAADHGFADRIGRLEILLRELATNPPCSCSACRSSSREFPLDPPQIPLPIAFPGELALEAKAA